MQTAINISNLILCTIGFLCIYLKIDTKQKSILKERSKRKVTKLRKYFITGEETEGRRRQRDGSPVSFFH